MPRSRNIKPSVCQNLKLSKLQPHTRILFRDLPMFANHLGLLVDCHETIKIQVFPFEPELNVNKLLQELADAGFIIRYQERPLSGQDSTESRFIWIINFLNHQNPHKNERATPSKIPVYNLNTSIRVKDGTTPDKDGSTPADSLNLIPESLNPVDENLEVELKEIGETPQDPFMPDCEGNNGEPDEPTQICKYITKHWKMSETKQRNYAHVRMLLVDCTKEEVIKAIDNAILVFDNEDVKRKYRTKFSEFFSSALEVKDMQENSVTGSTTPLKEAPIHMPLLKPQPKEDKK